MQYMVARNGNPGPFPPDSRHSGGYFSQPPGCSCRCRGPGPIKRGGHRRRRTSPRTVTGRRAGSIVCGAQQRTGEPVGPSAPRAVVGAKRRSLGLARFQFQIMSHDLMPARTASVAFPLPNPPPYDGGGKKKKTHEKNFLFAQRHEESSAGLADRHFRRFLMRVVAGHTRKTRCWVTVNISWLKKALPRSNRHHHWLAGLRPLSPDSCRSIGDF